MRFRIHWAACCVAALVLAAPASAQVQALPEVNGGDWLRLQLRGHLRDGVAWREIEQRMLSLYRSSEGVTGGVTAQSARMRRDRRMAQIRAGLIHQKLAFDLDNDGAVSREELIAAFTARTAEPLQSNGMLIEPTPEQRQALLQHLIANALKDDSDGNGILDFAEIRAAADRLATRQSEQSLQDPTLVPMTLDADRDGVVTRAEYVAALRAVFDEIDTNRDGTVDAAERQAITAKMVEIERARAMALQAQRIAAEQEKTLQACRLPQLAEGSKLVVFSAYEGRGLSTVSLGDDDVEVTVADVVIEQGEGVLDIVLLSYDAQIWRLRGAVGRIGRVIASSYHRGGPNDATPRVGVTGVPADKVVVPGRSDCLRYFSSEANADRPRTLAAIATLTKRTPDAVFATYGVSTLSLPSGQLDEKATLPAMIALPVSGPATAVWRQMLRFNPSGLIRINPSDVVSPLAARSYAVLPQQAGLAQLVEDGTLTASANGRDFTIHRKMRFPAGLNGAHSVRFVLGRDVPLPEGSPGHSCVISEATGLSATGPRPGCTP